MVRKITTQMTFGVLKCLERFKFNFSNDHGKEPCAGFVQNVYRALLMQCLHNPNFELKELLSLGDERFQAEMNFIDQHYNNHCNDLVRIDAFRLGEIFYLNPKEEVA